MNESFDQSLTAWLPDLLFVDGEFVSGKALVWDASGRVISIGAPPDGNCRVVRLKSKALLPGLVNAHSHAFQRVLRGRTEHRTTPSQDSFWTWREMMYSAAERLQPEDLYDASRMAFLEMALSGITAVGEFHYLHRPAEGGAYSDPNLLAKTVIGAAADAGLRIALLRVAYARSGYRSKTNNRQIRFIEDDPDEYLTNLDGLRTDLAKGDKERAWVGVAPHSIRAVPLSYLKHIIVHGNELDMPIHMHVAEQPAEILASVEEYGREPIQLLDTEGLLSKRFTCIHAIHVSEDQVKSLAEAGAMVCACPTTERSLGDGIFPAAMYFQRGVRVSLGTDSQIQVDLLEDSRELEYHLRLRDLRRAVLSPEASSLTDLASRLFECATVFGAESIGSGSGKLAPGHSADFFTVDLNDPSIAGSEPGSVLANIIFSSARSAIREVVVGGKIIVADGHHAAEHEIVTKFNALQRNLWC